MVALDDAEIDAAVVDRLQMHVPVALEQRLEAEMR